MRKFLLGIWLGVFIIPDTVVPPYGAGGLSGLNGGASGDIVHELHEEARIFDLHELWPSLCYRRTPR